RKSEQPLALNIDPPQRCATSIPTRHFSGECVAVMDAGDGVTFDDARRRHGEVSFGSVALSFSLPLKGEGENYSVVQRSISHTGRPGTSMAFVSRNASGPGSLPTFSHASFASGAASFIRPFTPSPVSAVW